MFCILTRYLVVGRVKEERTIWQSLLLRAFGFLTKRNTKCGRITHLWNWLYDTASCVKDRNMTSMVWPHPTFSHIMLLFHPQGKYWLPQTISSQALTEPFLYIRHNKLSLNDSFSKQLFIKKKLWKSRGNVGFGTIMDAVQIWMHIGICEWAIWKQEKIRFLLPAERSTCSEWQFTIVIDLVSALKKGWELVRFRGIIILVIIIICYWYF